MRFLAKTNGDTVLPSLHREMNKLFSDVWGATVSGSWMPALDVRESREAVGIKVELPGIDPEKVEISVTGDLLEIRGEKSVERESGDENDEVRWHRFERRSGKFVRAFQLPADVDSNAVEAESRNGLLTIRLPKREDAKARKVEIAVR